MKKHIIYFTALLIIGCDSNLKKWMTYDEKQEIEENSNSKIKKLQYKRIQSVSTDKNELIKGYENEINLFLESKYNKLETLIIENLFLKFSNILLMENLLITIYLYFTSQEYI